MTEPRTTFPYPHRSLNQVGDLAQRALAPSARRRAAPVPVHQQEPLSGRADEERRRIDAQQGSAALLKRVRALIAKGCR
ncbi:MAG TPA: hypothetical protein VGW34_10655 [Allosphingosinicella sp.]|nr:hypothetical protein [Allosphingosinicella sp.]